MRRPATLLLTILTLAPLAPAPEARGLDGHGERVGPSRRAGRMRRRARRKPPQPASDPAGQPAQMLPETEDYHAGDPRAAKPRPRPRPARQPIPDISNPGVARPRPPAPL